MFCHIFFIRNSKFHRSLLTICNRILTVQHTNIKKTHTSLSEQHFLSQFSSELFIRIPIPLCSILFRQYRKICLVPSSSSSTFILYIKMRNVV
ncbi:hypothetical protein DERP_005896 [Dermatophagoides pteronyssinus]|uniref:Uncharacterized protein n=1 Tax=Dermatophagoides pteronyssinus TaxID=6956 RepID=A0ABQ8J9V3_DERPT|nr:hypothetical protein DERP_005896 [Dermatophagoides pteronyssinus]